VTVFKKLFYHGVLSDEENWGALLLGGLSVGLVTGGSGRSDGWGLYTPRGGG